jgi:hypothetical protein
MVSHIRRLQLEHSSRWKPPVLDTNKRLLDAPLHSKSSNCSCKWISLGEMLFKTQLVGTGGMGNQVADPYVLKNSSYAGTEQCLYLLNSCVTLLKECQNSFPLRSQ